MSTKFEYLVLLFIILVSGLATKIFRGVEITLFFSFISLVYLAARGALTNRRYMVGCAVWIVYVVLSYIKYPGDNYFWPFLYICNLTIAFAIVRYYGLSLLAKYTDILYFLSVLSLVFYGVQLLALDAMLPIWVGFDMSGDIFDKPYTHYAHSFLYTIHQFKDAEKGFPRNSGFCWEPGAFACFLVIAIYFQLLNDRCRVELNMRRYLVFVVAIFSTQSTTGFVALIAVFVGYMLNVSSKVFFKYIFIAVLALSPLLFFLPEQLDKIEAQLFDDLNEQVMSLDANENEKGIGRFQSILILATDFVDNPILGIGANRSLSWVSRMGLDVNPTSGIGNMFATYGLFLMIPFFYLLFRSSFLFAKKYNCRGQYVFGLSVLILGFSFAVLETPLFLSLIFFGYFYFNKDSDRFRARV